MSLQETDEAVRRRELDALVRDAERLLRHWRLTVSDGGLLSVAPIGSRLRLVELGRLMRRLRLHCRDGIPRSLLFDLRSVEMVGASQAETCSAVRQFAIEIGVACRIVS